MPECGVLPAGLVTTVVAALAALACADSPAAPSAADGQAAEPGFVALFDGKTLDGWQGAVDGYEVRDGAIQSSGTAITKILPPASRFSKGGGHSAKKQAVLEKLGEYFDRFFGLS